MYEEVAPLTDGAKRNLKSMYRRVERGDLLDTERTTVQDLFPNLRKLIRGEKTFHVFPGYSDNSIEFRFQIHASFPSPSIFQEVVRYHFESPRATKA